MPGLSFVSEAAIESGRAARGGEGCLADGTAAAPHRSLADALAANEELKAQEEEERCVEATSCW